jgi:hypothetical protein
MPRPTPEVSPCPPGDQAAALGVLYRRVPDVLRPRLIADAVEEARFGRSGVTRVRVVRESDDALIALFSGRSRSLGRPLTPG